MDRPFVPHWDPTEIVVESASARDVHHIGGANHFLHMVEHVTMCIRDRELPLFPAEDGVANVEACVAILDAARRSGRRARRGPSPGSHS